jgi:hypothetical protein
MIFCVNIWLVSMKLPPKYELLSQVLWNIRPNSLSTPPWMQDIRKDVRGFSMMFKNYKCTVTKKPFMYSFSGNCAASVPISTFMCVCERFIYSQDWSTYFPTAE